LEWCLNFHGIVVLISGMKKTKQKRLVRRSRHQSAWIEVGGKSIQYECILMDVSLNGAKIFVDLDVPIPSSFSLIFVPHSRAKRNCQVVWRRGRLLGLKFVA
jgi:hypothetical protein